jgi:hypothetical protein
MKGFLFSIEALFTIAVIILITSTLYYAGAYQQKETTPFELQNQSDAAMTMYFNTPTQQGVITSEIQYCTKVSVYKSTVNAMQDKNVCRWVK